MYSGHDGVAWLRGGVRAEGAGQAEGRELQGRRRQASLQQLVRPGQRLVAKDPTGAGSHQVQEPVLQVIIPRETRATTATAACDAR